MTNNMSVGFTTFALGITGGLGTIYMMAFNGLLIGGFQTAWRLLRCGPWTAGGFDPVREHRHVFGRRVNVGG